MAPLPPFDREMLIFFFPLGMLLVPEEMSGICHALPPAASEIEKEAVKYYIVGSENNVNSHRADPKYRKPKALVAKDMLPI